MNNYTVPIFQTHISIHLCVIWQNIDDKFDSLQILYTVRQINKIIFLQKCCIRI